MVLNSQLLPYSILCCVRHHLFKTRGLLSDVADEFFNSLSREKAFVLLSSSMGCFPSSQNVFSPMDFLSEGEKKFLHGGVLQC